MKFILTIIVCLYLVAVSSCVVRNNCKQHDASTGCCPPNDLNGRECEVRSVLLNADGNFATSGTSTQMCIKACHLYNNANKCNLQGCTYGANGCE